MLTIQAQTSDDWTKAVIPRYIEETWDTRTSEVTFAKKDFSRTQLR